MPKRYLTPLPFEKSRLLARTRAAELWEGRIDGRLHVLKRLLSGRPGAWNDYTILSQVRHPLLIQPEYAGVLRNGQFAFTMPLDFQPQQLPEDWDFLTFCIQFISLTNLLHHRGLVFRCDPNFLLFDSQSSKPYFAGMSNLRVSTDWEIEEHSRIILETLRNWPNPPASKQLVLKILKSWERRKQISLTECLKDLLSEQFVSPDLMTCGAEVLRRRETEMVTGLFQLAQRSCGRAVVFQADPGEGKSTLLRQIFRELAGRNAHITFCSASSDDRPYHLLRKLLDRFFENTDSYSKCRTELSLGRWTQFMHGSADVSEERIVSLFIQILEFLKLSNSQCFVFLVDDLDRADSQSLSMLSRIVRHISNQRVLFIFTASTRFTELSDSAIQIQLESMKLNELSGSCIVPLWKKEQRQTVLQEIFNRTSGNPLLFQEYLREVFKQNHNALKWEDTGWTLPNREIPALPGVLSNFYLSQLPELTGAERYFLECASVQGPTFDQSFIEGIAEDRSNIIQSLQQKGILIQTDGQLQFRKPLLADFLYGQTDPERLSGFHQNIAQTLLKNGDGELDPRISKHLLKGGQYDLALKHACRTMDENRPGTVQVVLPVLEELDRHDSKLNDQEKLMLHCRKGDLLFRKGNYPAAAESYRKAIEKCPNDKNMKFDLSVRIARCHLLNNDILLSLKLLKSLSPEAITDSRLLLPYYFTSGVCAWHRGNREDQDFDKALQIAEQLQDFESLASGYRQRAELALRDGSFADAQVQAQKVLRYSKKTANDTEIGLALRVLGSAAFHRSMYEKAERTYKRSISYLRRAESLDGMARVWNQLGNLYLEIYRFNDAVKAFRTAAALFSQLEHPLEVSLAHFNMGLIFIEQGKLREAEKIYLRCRAIDKKAGNRLYFAYDIRALAVIAFQRGFFRKADRLLKRTIEICEELHAEADVLQTKLILLYSLLEQKNYREARSYVDFVQQRLSTLQQEPMARSEIHYLLAQYYCYTNEINEAVNHIEEALKLARKIHHYKLIGMALILRIILRNSPPSRNDADLKNAIRNFRKSRNELRFFDSMLKLYEAFPALVRDRWHSRFLVRMEKGYREILNQPRHRQLRRLARSASPNRVKPEPLYEWWQSLLASLSGVETPEHRLVRVLSTLSEELHASLAILRYQTSTGESVEYSHPVDSSLDVACDLQNRIYVTLELSKETVLLDPDHEADFMNHPAVRLHNISSILAVPILRDGQVCGMWYFERWDQEPPFTRSDSGKASFFATASSPVLANALRPATHYRHPDVQVLRSPYSDLIGTSPRMQNMYRQMARAAPVDISVLIFGESGTGKELIARNLHRSSQRSSGPFQALNCSALPETLLESELFGYARGAFTGATMSRQGLIEKANGGTLFLDEIGDLTPAAQVKLLRVMQEREIQRLGETITRKVDVRFIFATHKDLKKSVQEGSYREDLFYRVSVHMLNVPPLRERKEDIAALIAHFTEKYSKDFGKENITFTSSAVRAFTEYEWPGNVRELENVIQSTLVSCESGKSVSVHDLPSNITGGHRVQRFAGHSLEDAKNEFEREFLQQALNRNKWNKTQTAKELKITRQGLMNMIQRLNIREP
ncbi:sigma 54-interacting transcriptional regulator [bacterium]|nr:sigma 54-interacting transcriptional regulator [bacterium]